MATNESFVERWVESLNRGQPALGETFAADARIHLIGHDDVHDPQTFAGFLSAVATAFPDIKFSIDGLHALGDVVAFRWSARGTHRGDLLGIAPTGRPVTILGMIIDRFSGGKVVERWEHYDRLGMLQQVGAIPTPG